MNACDYTMHNLAPTSWLWIRKQDPRKLVGTPKHLPVDLLQPLRQWIERVEIATPEMARFLCQLIPSQCPFERDIKFFGRTLFHIPPMCKLNPLYEEVVALRFRALCYLADECGEDVTAYCRSGAIAEGTFDPF